ncbi:hypothetical protein O181_116923, partial [Austropuccinia psidii MF-1]|nr:hypothetical protein [Austropuccinia psidii MF-1]
PCAPAREPAHANAHASAPKPTNAHTSAPTNAPAPANAHASAPTPAVLCGGLYQHHLQKNNPAQAESFQG